MLRVATRWVRVQPLISEANVISRRENAQGCTIHPKYVKLPPIPNCSTQICPAAASFPRSSQICSVAASLPARLKFVLLQLVFSIRLKYVPSQLAFSRSAYFCTDLDTRLKYVSGVLSNNLTRSKYAPPYWYKSGSSGISRLNHVCTNIGSVRAYDGEDSAAASGASAWY